MSEPEASRIPTEEELKQLPRWARVAFAARCARRVQPLFKASWPEAPQKHVEALDRAVTLSEQAAAYAYADARADAAAALRRDYDLLLAASNELNWTDDTPVPPEFFGPMWPEGTPEGWPEEGIEERVGTARYRLRLKGPPGEPAEKVVENTRRLIDLIDRVNRATGGRGIHIDDDDLKVHDDVFFGAPTPTGPVPVGGGA